jgi:hypothetical protein
MRSRCGEISTMSPCRNSASRVERDIMGAWLPHPIASSARRCAADLPGCFASPIAHSHSWEQVWHMVFPSGMRTMR